LDGNDYSIYFRMKYLSDPGETASRSILRLGGVSAAQRGIYVYFYYRRIRVLVNDGATSVNGYGVYAVDTILSADKYTDVLLQIDGTGKTVTIAVYNDNGTLINTNSSGVRTGTVTTINIASLTLNSNDNTAAYTFDNVYNVTTNFKKFSGLKTITQCLDETYVTGIQIHYPNILATTDISGNGNHLNRSAGFTSAAALKYYTDINNYLLDYGYDDYQRNINDSLIHRKIPYKADGTIIKPDYPTASIWMSGYRIVGEYPASATKVNTMQDCKIRFTDNFFDRSNATIWGDAARLGYYDASNKKDFHISELNQRTLYEWLNAGYKGRLYVKMTDNSIEKWDRKLLSDVFLYATDKTLDSNKTILTYTGDLFAQVLTGFNGTTLYDANDYVHLGYLQSDSAMFTIRFDDGDVDVIDHYYPLLNSLTVPHNMVSVHSSEVGTTGTYEYMDWAELGTLHTNGWDVLDHGYRELTLVDYQSSLDYVDSTYQHMLWSKALIESHGIDCDYFMGHRHTDLGIHVAYFAHKVGYSANFCTGIDLASQLGAGYDAANPKKIDKYLMTGMSGDLTSTYNLDKTPNTTEIAAIEAQLDICKSQQRWGIYYFHNYSATIGTALTTVINYAKTNGISLVNATEGFNLCRYLP
jgi:hypothetical protein